MKKLIIVLITVVLVANCVGANTVTKEEILPLNEWVYNNIKYSMRSDFELLFIQSPEKTMRLGTGVCSDMSVLLMNLIYINYGVKTEYIVLDYPGTSEHAVIYYEGTYYNPTSGSYIIESEINEDKILERISYNDIMFLAIF